MPISSGMEINSDTHQSTPEEAESGSRNLILTTLILFVGIKFILWSFGLIMFDKNDLIIDGTIIGILTLSLLLIGFLTGLILEVNEFKVPEKQHGLLFLGVFILLILSDMCLSGSCIPAAFFKGIMIIPTLIPVFIGYKISFFINKTLFL